MDAGYQRWGEAPSINQIHFTRTRNNDEYHGGATLRCKTFESHLRRALKYSVEQTKLPSVDAKERSQTLVHANELVKRVEERIMELRSVWKLAQWFIESQTAADGSCRSSRGCCPRQETVRQGRSIMLFTVVTIIFVSLKYFKLPVLPSSQKI